MSARRTALSLLAALTLLAAACSGDDGGDAAEPTTIPDETTDDSEADRDDGESSAGPLFERDLDAALLGRGIYSAPVVVLPATDGLPWTLAGWQHDPKRQASIATVWESLDARTWYAIELPDLDDEVSSESVADVVVHAGERWALGQIGEGSGIGLWRTDGAEWEAVDAEGFDRGLYPSGIASNGKVVLVWAATAGSGRTVLFTSSDGQTFQRIDDRFGGGDSRAVVDVTWTSGRWIAAGWVSEGGSTIPVTWTSTDASEWSRVDLPATGATRAWASSIVAGPAGVVVGGSRSQDGEPGLPVSWRSTDGATWEDPVALPLHDDGRTTSGDLDVTSLSTDGTTIVAAGGSDWRPHVWTSTDGAAWQLAPNPIATEGFEQGIEPSAVGIAAGTTVLTSSAPAAFVLDGDRWSEVGRASGAITAQTEWPYAYAVTAGPDGGLVLAGAASTPAGPGHDATDTPVTWTEGDGWTRTNLPALGGFVAGLTSGDGGLFAVGSEDFGVASRAPGDHNPDAMVWHSADGQTWTFLTPGSPDFADDDRTNPEVMAAYRSTEGLLGGAGTQRLQAIVALGDGFVAAGTTYWADTGTGVDPWVVSSPDRVGGASERPQEPVPGDQYVNGACTDGSVVVAVGGAEDAIGQVDAAAWLRSASGEWSSIDVGGLRAVGYDALAACTHDGERFVAVGAVSDGERQYPIVATSADGAEWRSVPVDREGDANTTATAVAALPDGGAVVVGDQVGTGDVAVWHLSAEGELSRVDTGDDALTAEGTQRAFAVAVLADEVVIVGEDVGGVGVWRSSSMLDELR